MKIFWKATVRTLFFCGLMIPLVIAGEPSTKTISIVAQRFSFTPNEITVKKGEEVTLVIESKDVSHGLLIEDLGVRAEIKKGKASEVKFTPETVGTFEGKCAHFCGKEHGSMKLTVHVIE